MRPALVPHRSGKGARQGPRAREEHRVEVGRSAEPWEFRAEPDGVRESPTAAALSRGGCVCSRALLWKRLPPLSYHTDLQDRAPSRLQDSLSPFTGVARSSEPTAENRLSPRGSPVDLGSELGGAGGAVYRAAADTETGPAREFGVDRTGSHCIGPDGKGPDHCTASTNTPPPRPHPKARSLPPSPCPPPPPAHPREGPEGVGNCARRACALSPPPGNRPPAPRQVPNGQSLGVKPVGRAVAGRPAQERLADRPRNPARGAAPGLQDSLAVMVSGNNFTICQVLKLPNSQGYKADGWNHTSCFSTFTFQEAAELWQGVAVCTENMVVKVHHGDAHTAQSQPLKNIKANTGLAAPQRKMKVAVLSVALLFTILLCTPEDAQELCCAKEGFPGGLRDSRRWDMAPTVCVRRPGVPLFLALFLEHLPFGASDLPWPKHLGLSCAQPWGTGIEAQSSRPSACRDS
ncbi:uncharacterized protein [Patagioenas fasciata]|uniref:uncharacterized protein n=1 Tax=Patagioenas fasciata TaxID=372321 RepID=UPI003A9A4091